MPLVQYTQLMTKTALIIDDDRTERRIIAQILKTQLDLAPVEAANGEAGLQALGQHPDSALIILDLDMPVMDGRKALTHIARDYPGIPVIILTGSTDMMDTVQVMKNGAFDFLSKPVEHNRLIVSARNALKLSVMSQEISRLQRKTDGALLFSDLIGHRQGLLDAVQLGKKTAATLLPALITGETGTGKEMFARAIHGESARAGQPFIAVNCGALPEKLVESTLFGHEKGAFTGAIQKTLGKFQEANGGTLFLDEVGELPLETQVKLLRALQQKEIEPVGASKSVKVDVRVISATNKNLTHAIQVGQFREDLYFRLNVLHLDLPALRHRLDDIEEIAHHFIDLFCASHQTLPKSLSPAALQRLMQHAWPGNVRELENTINRGMALCDDDVIDIDDLALQGDTAIGALIDPQHVISILDAQQQFRPLKEIEHDIIVRALEHHGQNIARTARVLGIAKSTLYAKMPQADDKSAKNDL